MIRIITLFFLAFFFADAGAGFYLNAGVGYSDADYPSVPLQGPFQPRSVTGTGIAPQIALGYAFNRISAVELGAIYFYRPRFVGIGFNPNQINRVKHNLVHLVFRLSAPLGSFDVYVKGGVGYVVRADILIWNGSTFITALTAGQFIRPVYGLGADYRIGAHWGLDLNWMQAPKQLSQQLPASNFYGLGAFYRF